MLGIIFHTVRLFFGALNLLIIVRALMSWFRPRGYNRLYYDIERVVYNLTEPILGPIRNVLPPIGPGIDFSPLIAIILLDVVKRLVLELLSAIMRF